MAIQGLRKVMGIIMRASNHHFLRCRDRQSTTTLWITHGHGKYSFEIMRFLRALYRDHLEAWKKILCFFALFQLSLDLYLKKRPLITRRIADDRTLAGLPNMKWYISCARKNEVFDIYSYYVFDLVSFMRHFFYTWSVGKDLYFCMIKLIPVIGRALFIPLRWYNVLLAVTRISQSVIM